MEKQITGFKKEGRRFPKILVLLDGEDWIALDPETVVRERLRTGDALDAARRGQIIEADEAIRARKAAAGHAVHGPKTGHDLESYLHGRRFSEQAIHAALAALRASGTLDDERAAGRIVRERRRRKDVGPKRLRAELSARGIPAAQAQEKIGKALEDADLAAECLQLARRRAARDQTLDQQVQRRKLAVYLLRRGYEAESVWRAIGQLCAERGIAVNDEEEPISNAE